MSRLRVGIIGSGWVARNRHIPCWRRAGAEIISICTLASKSDTRRLFKVNNVTQDLDELIRQKPDVVSVCSPPQLHLKHTTSLVSNGIPVLLEKPLVESVEEAQQLRQLAVKYNVPICPAHSFRFCRAVLQGLNFIASGKAGQILYVEGIQLSSFNRRLPTWYNSLHGGLYWDEAPHLAYLMNTFLPRNQVKHASVTWGNEATPKTVTAELESSGTKGSLHMVFGSAISEWHIIIIATNAIIDMDLFKDICIILPSDGQHGRFDVAKTSASGVQQFVYKFCLSGWKHLNGKLYYGHDELIRRYAIELKPPLDIIEDGIPAVQLTHNILAMASHG